MTDSQIKVSLNQLNTILRWDLCECGNCQENQECFHCGKCNKYVPYCYGADDEYFAICNDCYILETETETLTTALDSALGIVEGKSENYKALIKEALTNGINLLSLKDVLLILKEIAQEADARQPYFEWAKDAKLLETLAEYIEN